MIAIAPSDVQQCFLQKIKLSLFKRLILQQEKNEALKSIFSLTTELVSYSKKQTKNQNDLNKLSYCCIGMYISQAQYKYDTTMLR